MQRHSNVGVARLYDWSEQEREEWLSVSRLYREIAGGAGVPLPRGLSEKVASRLPPNHGGPGGALGAGAGPGAGGTAVPGSPRLSPGRMFLRDKGMLTKGEREIIQGIYKNRGDLKKPPAGHKSEFFVRSHHDAWLVGKPGLSGNKPSTEIPRDSPHGTLMEVTAPANHGSASESSRTSAAGDGSGEREEQHGEQAHTTCIVCLREQQLRQQLQQQQHLQQQHKHLLLQQQQQQQQQQKQQCLPRQRKAPSASVPSLPLTSALRPINVNDTFRPRGEERPVAPPTSPSHPSSLKLSTTSSPTPSSSTTSITTTGTSRPLHKRPELVASLQADPRICEELIDLTEQEEATALSDEEGSQGSGSSRRKVHVQVFLPQVGPEATVLDEDLKGRGPVGLPALARERPLSHKDLKKDKEIKDKDLRKDKDFGQDQGGGLPRQDAHTPEPARRGEEMLKEAVGENGMRTAGQHPRGRRSRSTHSASTQDNAAGQPPGVDSDSDSGKVSGRRLTLYSHPVTILKADAEEHPSQLDATVDQEQ